MDFIYILASADTAIVVLLETRVDNSEVIIELLQRERARHLTRL